MASLDQKIDSFISNHFPEIDYSVLGNNSYSESHKRALRYEYFVNSIEYYNLQKAIDNEEIIEISTEDMRGIDGCFVVINNQFFIVPDMENSALYSDWEENINNSLSRASRLQVDFVFIQSKSSKTELDKFKGFCDAVYDIFSSEPSDLHAIPKIKSLKYIFKEVSKKDHSMHLKLKLCAINKDARTIERLLQDQTWSTAIEKQKRELRSIVFTSVDIQIKSGQDYQEKLEAILAPNQRDYPIQHLKNRFVELTNEKATCYIGYLNLLEIKNLVDDGNGNLDDVFFDNIRYFEGFGDEDSINSKIYNSLTSNGDIFHLLHNGITITAHSKHFNPENGNLEIKAFSIINGCQTSNIIWEWIKDQNHQDEILAGIKIPVKIIISSNTNLRSKVTETANTSNEVKSIQLISISDEAKEVQKMFESEIRSGDKLYYERLSNQFPEIGSSYKLQTTDLFRSYYSSFGRSPHKLTVGYGGFEKEMLKRKEFLGTKPNGQTKQDLQSYYISGVLFNYLERYLRSRYPYLLSLRHHLLLLLFISIDEDFDLNANDYKKKVPDTLMQGAIELAKSKSKFDERTKVICDLAIDHFDFFIKKKDEKPKVILKSYYTEEGTEKMIAKFKEKYSWVD